MKRNRYLMPFVILTAAALLFTALVFVVDRVPEGYEGTVIGFAGVNLPVRDAIGFREGWYVFSTWIQRFALVLAAGFAVLGALQLFSRKKLLKVDPELLALAVTYAVTAVLYVLFDKLPINYRPLLPPNETEIETSFPSTSTMLAVVIFGTAVFALKKYLRHGPWLGIARIVLPLLAAGMVVGRMLSGVHWLTDILGGVFYGAALIAFYRFLLAAVRGRLRTRAPKRLPRRRAA